MKTFSHPLFFYSKILYLLNFAWYFLKIIRENFLKESEKYIVSPFKTKFEILSDPLKFEKTSHPS